MTGLLGRLAVWLGLRRETGTAAALRMMAEQERKNRAANEAGVYPRYRDYAAGLKPDAVTIGRSSSSRPVAQSTSRSDHIATSTVPDVGEAIRQAERNLFLEEAAGSLATDDVAKEIDGIRAALEGGESNS